MKPFILKRFLLFLFLGSIAIVNSQEIDVEKFNARWFASIDLGIQMSGIKSEDFVDSNYSALQRVSFGRWISPTFGARVGYQGRYFNTISHERRRYYDFYFGEALIDIRNLFSKTKKERKYKLIGHIGGGYFYNHDYDRSNIYSVLGLINSISVTKNFNLTIDLSAISGWDIYQGNSDILPGLSLGIFYLFD
ncbi:hypothetical protein RQM59_13730 [Flavobacteriaceae bacterium S356]|uniref:DUF3575 domain-containing protein n=1 Tax=Asprobacillus argus TaxID=3076534 RepID=A0ABU3LIX4_9FLAO|nr:hypothetical protein [Flavobacteriaceae bacterium S356]